METNEVFKSISAGGDFIAGLREDGYVIQTKNGKLVQIPDLTKIIKITCGNGFGLAMNEFGIIYEWNSETLAVKEIERTSSKIIDISAKNNQRLYITSRGTILGEGDILNGEMQGMQDAIKAEVLQDRILILKSDGTVCEYVNGMLQNKVLKERVIDISGNMTNVLYQTVRRKNICNR